MSHLEDDLENERRFEQNQEEAEQQDIIRKFGELLLNVGTASTVGSLNEDAREELEIFFFALHNSKIINGVK